MAPCEIWWKLLEISGKKAIKKLYIILYMYIAKGQGQVAPGRDKNLYIMFSYFDYTLQISAISPILFEKMIFQHFPNKI